MESIIKNTGLLQDLCEKSRVPIGCRSSPTFSIAIKVEVTDATTGTPGVDYHSASIVVGGKETITATCPLVRDERCRYPDSGCLLKETGIFEVSS